MLKSGDLIVTICLYVPAVNTISFFDHLHHEESRLSLYEFTPAS